MRKTPGWRERFTALDEIMSDGGALSDPMPTAHELAERFGQITGEMAELKRAHRARRAELARKYAADRAALRREERDLSARRARVALAMTHTGRSLDDLGRMAGVSGPFICVLARKARENQDGREGTDNRHGDTGTGPADRRAGP